MDNILTTISFSIYSNKGIYALLLGSGTSKSAGIPTGWDILIDLIRKIAILKKEVCDPDPISWYKNKFHKDPDYSNLLSKLVLTPSERVNLLKPYLEPNDSDIEQNLKVPTRAHYQIANLVKKGYIKVIITTNFDRLLESALESVGIHPTVIKHSNDIDGVMPIVHSDFLLIKVNGDYLDNRFLNTKVELARYNENMRKYLLQIFNEFGIISCGWSGKWDIGLVEIINQCQNFRFASFWTYRDKCEKELKEIAKRRKGQLVEILNADDFFFELNDKVEALEVINDNHPLNSEIALVRLKKFIVKGENQILLYDLFVAEIKDTKNKIKEFENFSLYPEIQLFTRYESSIDTILKLTICGVYWSKKEHINIFLEILSRVAEPAPDPHERFYEPTRKMHYYPAMLILFSLGITALKANKYELLANCFNIKIFERDSESSNKYFLITETNSWLIEPKIFNEIFGSNLKTPLSSHINQVLRPYFNEIISSNQEYNDYFDLFEYILCWYFLCYNNEFPGDWVPFGQFKWRSLSDFRKTSSIFREFFLQGDVQQNEWFPLKEGLFQGNYEKYKEIKGKMDKFLKGFFL
jgi:hypothetical protein